jgi:hypothetical protein
MDRRYDALAACPLLLRACSADPVDGATQAACLGRKKNLTHSTDKSRGRNNKSTGTQNAWLLLHGMLIEPAISMHPPLLPPGLHTSPRPKTPNSRFLPPACRPPSSS